MNTMKWLAAALAVVASGHAFAAKNYCGEITNGYGPFDYYDPTTADMLPRVIDYHFTEDMQRTLVGATGLLGADIDYTLRAIPNHPAALALMARVALMTKVVKLPGANYPVECYFDRAIRFRPNDGVARAGYGNYLSTLGKIDQAIVMYKAAVDLNPTDAAINYNLGLLYYKNKDYDNANLYAKKAYALEFPLPGLKNLLVAAGKWTDKSE